MTTHCHHHPVNLRRRADPDRGAAIVAELAALGCRLTDVKACGCYCVEFPAAVGQAKVLAIVGDGRADVASYLLADRTASN